MGEEDEQMQTQEQIAALNRALVLQNRSVLQYSLTAGSLLGFEYAGITGELASFAQAELEDARHLVEKIVALGGEPTEEVAPPRRLWSTAWST